MVTNRAKHVQYGHGKPVIQAQRAISIVSDITTIRLKANSQFLDRGFYMSVPKLQITVCTLWTQDKRTFWHLVRMFLLLLTGRCSSENTSKIGLCNSTTP